ncbi:hypothetical protein Plhal304r1_c003g0012701 [Plasmopara halstedii]
MKYIRVSMLKPQCLTKFLVNYVSQIRFYSYKRHTINAFKFYDVYVKNHINLIQL